jgi:hypothetical protein
MSGTNKFFITGRNFILTVERFALVVAVIASITLIGWFLWLCHFGIDFTDEGFYLNWIADPRIYKASLSQFGFIYHPLYQLLGGNIVLLRQANILIMLSFAWLLFFTLFRTYAGRNEASDPWQPLPCAGLAFVLSTSALALLHLWLPTPNYNSLALQALLLAGVGILLAKADSSRNSLLGWGLIGFSGWLAFMAKPTTAAALGLVIAIYLVMSGKLRIRMLALSVAIAAILVLLSAWYIDGSVELFLLRLAKGAEDVQRLQAGYALSDIFRWDDFGFSRNEKITLAGSSIFIFFATYLSYSSGQAQRLFAAALTLLISAFCLLVLLRNSGFKLSLIPNFALLFRPLNFGLLFWAAPIGAVLAVATLLYKDFPRLPSRDSWALVISFVFFPYVYTIGSNSNCWYGASDAAIFWVLAGGIVLVLPQLHGTSWRIYLPLATMVQAGTVTLLSLSTESPYRQTQPLRQNHDMIQIAYTGSQLWVSPDFAIYVRTLDHLAKRGGFKHGTPMIDLTGHYPTALYVLGAKAVGLAWMIGGYPGSDMMASGVLDRVSLEDLKNAWILTEPAGPRKLSPDILKRYGIDLAKDYVEVGKLDSPTGYYPESYMQHLLKPAR